MRVLWSFVYVGSYLNRVSELLHPEFVDVYNHVSYIGDDVLNEGFLDIKDYSIEELSYEIENGALRILYYFDVTGRVLWYLDGVLWYGGVLIGMCIVGWIIVLKKWLWLSSAG